MNNLHLSWSSIKEVLKWVQNSLKIFFRMSRNSFEVVFKPGLMINRSKVGSTDQNLDQQIKSSISRLKLKSTDQKLDQQITSYIKRSKDRPDEI